MSYDDLMDGLSSAWRKVDAPSNPAIGNRYWVHTLKTFFEEPESLELSIPIPKPEPNKRRRKPKSKDQAENKSKRPRKDANQICQKSIVRAIEKSLLYISGFFLSRHKKIASSKIPVFQGFRYFPRLA